MAQPSFAWRRRSGRNRSTGEAGDGPAAAREEAGDLGNSAAGGKAHHRVPGRERGAPPSAARCSAAGQPPLARECVAGGADSPHHQGAVSAVGQRALDGRRGRHRLKKKKSEQVPPGKLFILEYVRSVEPRFQSAAPHPPVINLRVAHTSAPKMEMHLNATNLAAPIHH